MQTTVIGSIEVLGYEDILGADSNNIRKDKIKTYEAFNPYTHEYVRITVEIKKNSKGDLEVQIFERDEFIDYFFIGEIEELAGVVM